MMTGTTPMESLADILRVPHTPLTADAQADDAFAGIEDMTGEEFAKAVVHSVEFRRYIISVLILGTIPSGVLNRIMDMAGWVAPPKRVEHTGKGGEPIQTVTEVRRIIVRATNIDAYEEEPDSSKALRTH